MPRVGALQVRSLSSDARLVNQREFWQLTMLFTGLLSQDIGHLTRLLPMLQGWLTPKSGYGTSYQLSTRPQPIDPLFRAKNSRGYRIAMCRLRAEWSKHSVRSL